MTSDFLWAHRPKRGLKTRLLLHFHCTFPDPKVNSWFVGRVLMRSRVSVGDYTLNSVASTLTTNQSTDFLLDFVAGCVLTIGEGPGETNWWNPVILFSSVFWDEVRSDLCLACWRDTKDWMVWTWTRVFFGFQASSHSYFSWVADQGLPCWYPEKSQPRIWGVRVFSSFQMGLLTWLDTKKPCELKKLSAGNNLQPTLSSISLKLVVVWWIPNKNICQVTGAMERCSRSLINWENDRRRWEFLAPRSSILGMFGCFLKWWYPQNTPKWSFLVGKTMVVRYHHFRKPPFGASPDFGRPWMEARSRPFPWGGNLQGFVFRDGN